MSKVIAFVPDMIFSSRIAAAGHDSGQSTTIVRSPAALADAFNDNSPAALVILDLEAPCLDLSEVVALIQDRAPTAVIIAYMPHVRTELAEAARAAGIERVLARSAFVKQLPALLTELTPDALPPSMD